jgi:hypothetical protein
MSRFNQLEPDPGSNLYRNILGTIIASIVIIFIYYLPQDLDDARLIEIAQGTDASGTIDLVTLAESDRRPEKFEASPTQAKLLKIEQRPSKFCYIKAQVINGLIPLFTSRKIVSFELKYCR